MSEKTLFYTKKHGRFTSEFKSYSKMHDSEISIIDHYLVIKPQSKKIEGEYIDINKIKNITELKEKKIGYNLSIPPPYYEINFNDGKILYISFFTGAIDIVKDLHVQFFETLSQNFSVPINTEIMKDIEIKKKLKEEHILFYAEQHGRYSTERPPKGLKDAFITITSKRLFIQIKYPKQIIEVPLIEIVVAEKIDSSKMDYTGTVLVGAPPTQKRKVYTNITAKSASPFYITFYSNMSGWQIELHDEFYAILKSQLDNIEKEKELERLKEMQKPTNVYYINIPPQMKLSALAALKCPSCQAPLEYMPPCKCEHCGVMIELMK
ncbi:MAG: hypothetical protein ACFFCM_14130 [Promethearchaeota archaeon]